MSKDAKYPNIVRAVLETPWAILPSTLSALVEVLVMRVSGEQLTPEEIEARIGSGPSRRDASRQGSVAVIPIYGVLVPRADMFTQMSGGTSVERLRATLREAVADPDVSQILLNVDSPGGQTDLIQEFAADIRAARQKKPVTAVANTKAASAAYHLASQADELVVTPSGHVGSIGVFAAHDDVSAMQEKLGVKTTLVSAGKYKTEASPYEPLSDEARAHIQELVDEHYATFTADVAKGRKVSVETVRNGFGEGRMLSAKQALKEGMVDRIDTLEATLRRLGSAPPKPSPDPAPAPEPFTDEAATSGLSFASSVRSALGQVEQLAETARGFADVQQQDYLSPAKREQFAAIADALGEFGTVRDGIVALLEQTDPDKQRRELEQLAARAVVRIHKQREVA